MAVIVEAADDARVLAEGHAEAGEPFLHTRVERGRGRGEMRPDHRRLGQDRLIDRLLRIEDAQRIAFEPRAALRRQRLAVPGEVGDECRAIGAPALGIAQRIDLERDVGGDAEGLENGEAAGDRLGVGERMGGPDQLDVDLVELPVAAFLRPLVAEHRAGIEHFLRQRLGEAIGDERAADSGGCLGTQRDAFTRAVGEGVHLLRHDVGGLAEGAGEDARILEDRRRPLLEAEAFGDAARGLDDVAVAAEVVSDEIAGAADGLHLGHESSATPEPADAARQWCGLHGGFTRSWAVPPATAQRIPLGHPLGRPLGASHGRRHPAFAGGFPQASGDRGAAPGASRQAASISVFAT